jgi:hypothetical protein
MNRQRRYIFMIKLQLFIKLIPRRFSPMVFGSGLGHSASKLLTTDTLFMEILMVMSVVGLCAHFTLLARKDNNLV